MLALLLSLSALAAEPGPAAAVPPAEVRVRWKGETAWVEADGGPGEHLALEAPARLELRFGKAPPIRLEGSGQQLEAGLPVRRGEGMMEIFLDAQACEDGGTRCRSVQGRYQGQLDGKRGEMALSLVQGRGPKQAPAEATADLEAAMAQASREQKLVLVDFGATWCPPCNLLSAEVLHDPEDEGALDGFVLVEIDVDRPESWPAKHRYDVGGYPTLLVTRPDGTEVDRLLGYPGEAEALRWLDAVGSLPPLGALPEAGTVPPAEAAALSLRLARAGREAEASIYLQRSMEQPAGLDPSMMDELQLLLQDGPEAAIRLAGRPELPGDWIWPALAIAQEDPKVAEALRAALPGWLSRAEPVKAADLLYVAGSLAPQSEAQALFAAGAATLRAALSGQPDRDRGHWSSLGELLEKAGQPEQALLLLDEAVRSYPEEFTFHQARAGLLLGLDRPGEAVASAEKALQYGYGDNRLRAAERLARALAADGRSDEALSLIGRTLAEAARPEPGTRVRTFRYIKALETARQEIDAGRQAQGRASPR